MPEADPSAPLSTSKSESSDLGGLDPGELLARGLHTVKPSAGASPWEPPDAEELGRLLPQYRIEKLIGRGGMGAVYKGVQVNLDRPVAIKLLPAEIAEDKEFVARFEREARTLARLQHSRIVTIHDFGQTPEGHLYFVMEYIDGTNLREILRGPGLDPEQTLAVVTQLCDALQAAHREGIVHRDIKPENVLVTRDGYVKLADFGLARPAPETGTGPLTRTNMVMGTPEYMAPEQREGMEGTDHRSDIFALGVMLYEMLTGQTPRGVFDPPSRKLQVDVRIDEVVLKALQSAPERRYQKASEMKTDVDRIRTTPLPAVAPSVPKPERVKSFVPEFMMLLLLLAAVGYALWPKAPQAAAQRSAAGTPAPAPAPMLTPAPMLSQATAPVAVTSVTPAPTAPAAPSITPVPTVPTVVESATPAPESVDPARAAIARKVWMMSVGLPVATPPAAPAMETPIPEPPPSLLPVFSRQIPNLSAWVLAPLDEVVPGNVRQNLTFLREDLADEAQRHPVASAAAYQIAYQLCNTLLAILAEREQTRVRAGYRAAQADTTTGISNDQALSARRNYMMSMPQYRREQAQRAELKSQALAGAELLKQGPKVEWANRTDVLGRTIDNLYSQFRAALRGEIK